MVVALPVRSKARMLSTPCWKSSPDWHLLCRYVVVVVVAAVVVVVVVASSVVVVFVPRVAVVVINVLRRRILLNHFLGLKILTIV